MALTVPERRSSPRVYIDGPMVYREAESSDFLPGKIENISAGGTLIWIGEDLQLGNKLIVRVEPEGPDEMWADLVATLVYKQPEERGSLHGYGCSIRLA